MQPAPQLREPLSQIVCDAHRGEVYARFSQWSPPAGAARACVRGAAPPWTQPCGTLRGFKMPVRRVRPVVALSLIGSAIYTVDARARIPDRAGLRN
jgi:hypothetical protein